ncbi:hypothetical protein DL96DRAFT_1714722 [Flagelloscypha sp. PMI_526]|nr:hypothetical protein DL96DRAFT_1714722 [Flagelloscypha sp. PMI_526]
MSTTNLPSLFALELQIKIIQHAALDSSLTECVPLMILSKTFCHDVCDVAYHTIVLYSIATCEGFEALISSKPLSFFAHRTRALYASPLREHLFTHSYGIKIWIGLWTRIVSKLPSLRYLEAYSDDSFLSELNTNFQNLKQMQNLTSLAIDQSFSNNLFSLIRRNDPLVFSHVTHLKLLAAIGWVERVIELVSTSFPAVSYFMFPVHPALAERLAQSFTHLRVFLFIIQDENPANENSWIQAVQAQYPNAVALFWDSKALNSSPGYDRSEAFKREVNGETGCIWTKAEQEIASRVGLQTL